MTTDRYYYYYYYYSGEQGRSDGGGHIGIYTHPKLVTVLFTCATLTYVLKLQCLVKTYTPQIKFLATLLVGRGAEDDNLTWPGTADNAYKSAHTRGREAASSDVNYVWTFTVTETHTTSILYCARRAVHQPRPTLQRRDVTWRDVNYLPPLTLVSH